MTEFFVVLVIALIVVAGVAWKRGWLGKTNEDKIKAEIAAGEQAIKDKISGTKP